MLLGITLASGANPALGFLAIPYILFPASLIYIAVWLWDFEKAYSYLCNLLFSFRLTIKLPARLTFSIIFLTPFIIPIIVAAFNFKGNEYTTEMLLLYKHFFRGFIEGPMLVLGIFL